MGASTQDDTIDCETTILYFLQENYTQYNSSFGYQVNIFIYSFGNINIIKKCAFLTIFLSLFSSGSLRVTKFK